MLLGVNIGYEIDLWSVGCILAELYLGKPLFTGKNKDEILAEVSIIRFSFTVCMCRFELVIQVIFMMFEDGEYSWSFAQRIPYWKIWTRL